MAEPFGQESKGGCSRTTHSAPIGPAAARSLSDIWHNRPASFPDNGRTLTDDAADAFIAILTNGKVTGHNVGAHADLLSEFPYLGPPHKL